MFSCTQAATLVLGFAAHHQFSESSFVFCNPMSENNNLFFHRKTRLMDLIPLSLKSTWPRKDRSNLFAAFGWKFLFKTMPGFFFFFWQHAHKLQHHWEYGSLSPAIRLSSKSPHCLFIIIWVHLRVNRVKGWMPVPPQKAFTFSLVKAGVSSNGR